MKVLVSDNLSMLGVDKLKEAEGIQVDVNVGLAKEELIKIISGYEGLIVRSATKVTAEIIQAAKNLKVIGRAGIGVDNIDLEAAGKQGIIVMNAPEGNLITTAEHAVALMLAMARNIPRADASLKGGQWSPKKFMGVELYGKTLGIIGLGRIGSVVAQRAKAFAMKILVYDPFISKEHAERVGVEVVELNDLLARSDFTSLHAPATPFGPLLGKEAFAHMKPGMRIINCARGTLIDHEALVEAIESKKVAQAALDVYEKEPLPPESPLLNREEIITTPHLGASTGEAQDKVALIISEQVIDYLKHGEVRNAVNMPSIDAELLSKIKPYLVLGEDMGKLIFQLIDGAIHSVRMQYNGEVANLNVAPISIAVLKGLLSQTVDGVNMVNAPYIAKERGVEVQESKSNEIHDYTSAIQVEVTTEKGSRNLGGTLSAKQTPRIIKIDNYNFEAVFSKQMLVLTNNDKPGVIGKVGNILGENGVNIAGFQLGRLDEGGNAVAVINIDTAPTKQVLQALEKTENVLKVYPVTL
ncbi:MAG: phosphoglycerate dehydrogenase [Nitrospinota bacterium]|nr:phosphoglycerate dehydrogenase [Nitrospinota bacterium]